MLLAEFTKDNCSLSEIHNMPVPAGTPRELEIQSIASSPRVVRHVEDALNGKASARNPTAVISESHPTGYLQWHGT